MEFNVGDLIIATNLPSPKNGYVNGDIGWVVGDEHKYFQLFE